MADNVAITAGAGTTVATDDIGGVHYQRVKLVDGTLEGTGAIGGDATNGLDVDVTRVSGNVTVVDGGASLTTDTPQLPAALVGGRMDVNIGAAGATVPVSDAAGSLTVDSAQLPAALVGGRMDVNIGASAAVPVTDNAGTLSVDDGGGTVSVDDGGGALTVDGTVTVTQGTPAAAASGWPVKVTDGTDTVGISTVGGAKAIKVDVIQAVGSSAQTDGGAFTESTSKCEVIAGVFNDALGADLTEDKAGAVRATAKRALHVNLRNTAATEIGTAAAPVRTDPTGTTTQPVLDTNSAAALTSLQLADDVVGATGAAIPAKGDLVIASDGGTSRAIACNASGHVSVNDGGNALTVDGTVTANQGTANATPWNENLSQVGGVAVVAASAGIQKVGIVDEAGAAFSETNPLPVRQTYPEQTRFKIAATYSASQTDIALFTPTGGKRFVVCSITISPTATGVVKIFDNATATTTQLFQGTPGGTTPFAIQFTPPCPSEAVNNVLRYSTGAAATGDITVYGYEV